MKKQYKWSARLGKVLGWLLAQVIGIVLTVFIILILWMTIDQAFKFKRGLVCFRATEMQVGNGAIRITDPRPVYICNY